MSSHSEDKGLKCRQRSMVKMVLALLNMDVKEDISAASITDIMSPLRPRTKQRDQASAEMLVSQGTAWTNSRASTQKSQCTASNSGDASFIGQKQLQEGIGNLSKGDLPWKMGLY